MMAPSVYQSQHHEQLVSPDVSPLPPPSFVLTSSSREEESPGSPHSLVMADDVDSAIGDSGSPDMNGKSSQQQEVTSQRRWGSFRHSGRRLGSNALASQLYRSSSFNSSGRSSTCDTADDMCSDVSLEEDVMDLNHKVQMLQQQVSVLADNQSSTDDRYTRAKQDSAALQARVHMLEEQLRESELRAEERLQEEQKRHRELLVRIEREKQQQVENCNVRLQTLEQEGASFREECTRLRLQVERLRAEKQASEDLRREEQVILAAMREELQTLRDIERRAKDERMMNAQVVEELSEEIDRLKAEWKGGDITEAHSQSDLNGQLQNDLTVRLHELQVEVTSLRHQNKNLQETTEELQAQMLTRSLEEGRNLLTGVGSGNSLAEELEAMSAKEVGSCPLYDSNDAPKKDKYLGISPSLAVLVVLTVIFGARSASIYSFVSRLFHRIMRLKVIKKALQFSVDSILEVFRCPHGREMIVLCGSVQIWASEETETKR